MREMEVELVSSTVASWLAAALCIILPPPLACQDLVHLTSSVQARTERLHEPGPLIGAAQDGRGDLFLLDARSQVTIADSRLELLGTFGRSADGSMAFRDPVSIGVLSDGRVAVLDEGRQAIVVMRAKHRGAELVPEDTILVRRFARGMCTLPGGAFLIYGAVDGMRLHIYDIRGRVLRSFAPADPRLTPAQQDQFAMGQLGCDPEEDQVIITSAFSPAVEAFRISSGRRIWADTLRPYRAATVTIHGRGLTIFTPRGGHSVVASALRVGRCRMIQASYVGRQDGSTVDTVVTYVFGGASRARASVTLDVPRLVPLGGMAVLSVQAGRSLLELDRLRVDGCGVGSVARSSRPGMRAKTHVLSRSR